MKKENPLEATMLRTVLFLCICAVVCVSCSQRMYVASIEVTPAPGVILKDSTTVTVRDNALLVGFVSSSLGEMPVVGAGVKLTNLESGEQRNIGGTYIDGSFISPFVPGMYSMSVVHIDYNIFGPFIIELKPGDRREVHVDLSRESAFGKIDTLHSLKRLSLAEIRSLIIRKNPRLQTVAPDSILVKLIN